MLVCLIIGHLRGVEEWSRTDCQSERGLAGAAVEDGDKTGWKGNRKAKCSL